MKWSPPGPAFLFCPADRAERFQKASCLADVVILDLEDGVELSLRNIARNNIRVADLDPAVTAVRINSVSTDDYHLDLEALEDSPFRRVILSKVASASEVRELEDFDVIPLCETPQGFSEIGAIARCANTVALMWGAEDLAAAVGGFSSRLEDGRLRDVPRLVRAQVLLSAAQNGVGAIDAVYTDYADLDGQSREAADASATGFMATACIHPSQVEVIRSAYRPSPERLRWAEEIVILAESSGGVFSVNGRMIDEPVIAQARQLLVRSGKSLP